MNLTRHHIKREDEGRKELGILSLMKVEGMMEDQASNLNTSVHRIQRVQRERVKGKGMDGWVMYTGIAVVVVVDFLSREQEKKGGV